MHTTLSSDQSH